MKEPSEEHQSRAFNLRNPHDTYQMLFNLCTCARTSIPAMSSALQRLLQD
jgi:hypothetical protein